MKRLKVFVIVFLVIVAVAVGGILGTVKLGQNDTLRITRELELAGYGTDDEQMAPTYWDINANRGNVPFLSDLTYSHRPKDGVHDVVTVEKVAQLRPGMTVEQVTNLFGPTSKEIPMFKEDRKFWDNNGPLVTEFKDWTNTNISPNGEVLVRMPLDTLHCAFRDGKLVAAFTFGI